MLIENHNNGKYRLEELDSLPGEKLPDKNALWEKLYKRMGRKKHSKKVMWYWVAAACILFSLIIPMVIFNKKTYQADSFAIKQKPSGIKNPFAIISGKKDSAKYNNPALPAENEMTIEDKPNKTERKIRRGKEMSILHLPDTVSIRDLAAKGNNNSLQSMDTSSYLTATVPSKKKLNVVQINELGDPSEFQPESVRNSYKHTIQFKFANQEIFANPSIASAAKGFTLLKIKNLQTK